MLGVQASGFNFTPTTGTQTQSIFENSLVTGCRVYASPKWVTKFYCRMWITYKMHALSRPSSSRKRRRRYGWQRIRFMPEYNLQSFEVTATDNKPDCFIKWTHKSSGKHAILPQSRRLPPDSWLSDRGELRMVLKMTHDERKQWSISTSRK